MKNETTNNATFLSWTLGLSLVAALAFGYYSYNNSIEAEVATMEMKGKADSLTFMKNNLQNEIETLSAKLEAEMAESERTAEALEKANSELSSRKKSAYGFRSRQNKALNELQAKKDEEIAGLTSKLNELNELKSQMEKELEKIPMLEENVANLQGEVALWELKYAELEKSFEELNKRHARLIYDAPGDNFKIEILADNGKLTSKAKKAKTIKVSFLMPAYLQKEMNSNQTMYLSLFDEQIKPLDNWIEEVSIISPDKSIPIQVHAKQVVNYAKNPQTVSFTFEVDEKMKAGNYTGKVYSKDDYLGTVDFKLRDSFL